MSTTNNGFVNNLAPNLMVVSGETSQATYTASKFSDKISDVVKVTFDDFWRNNFRAAYNPLSDDASYRGMRREALDPSVSYDIKKHFRVKQIDGNTGKISAEGVAVRWVPGSLEGGSGSLFIKVLFHDSENPSAFNAENGVVFCNEATSGFSYGGKSFPPNIAWGGVAIKSIQTVSNVYKMVTVEPVNGTAVGLEDYCGVNNPHYVGVGLYQVGDTVYLKNNSPGNSGPCTNNELAKGKVISVAVNTGSNKAIVFVEFDRILPSSIFNFDVVDPPKTILCTGDENGNCTDSCASFRIANGSIELISTPTCGTVQRIIFNDEVPVNFLPNYELYQWKWEFAGNHEGNGANYRAPAAESVYKIKAEYINWDASTKTLVVLCRNNIFEIKYGNVYQKDGSGLLIKRGSAISASKSRFVRQTGSFVNISGAPDFAENIPYVSGREYVQNWPVTAIGVSSGELLVQTTSAGGTSYNPLYEYVPGEIVVQPLTTASGTSNIVTNYAAGRVVSWEPNKTALATIPSRLVIKRLEYGTTNPIDLESQNPLLIRNKVLSRFRFGSGLAATGSDANIIKNSQRNILPFRIFNNVITNAYIAPGESTAGTITQWYDFNSSNVKQSSSVTELEDPSQVSTTIGTIAKGSSIGKTRLKAFQQYAGNVYKNHLLDTSITFNSPYVSMKDVSEIGLLTQSGSPLSEFIYPVVTINQEIVNGQPTTILYEPLKDKNIVSLPGGSIIENVTEGGANLGANELTIQKLYNVSFVTGELAGDGNTVIVTIGSSIPNSEFVNTFSSDYSFAIDKNGNTLKLIKYVGLLNAGSQVIPSDQTTLFYDVLQDSVEAPRNRVVFRRRPLQGTTGITYFVFGAEIKTPVSGIIKTKQVKQFTEKTKLRYQSSGKYKGKWVAQLNEYDLTSLLSVFYTNGDNLITENHKDHFGISKEVDDYFYRPSILVLNSKHLKTNTNEDAALGPISSIVSQIPEFGVIVQDGTNALDYYVEIVVTGLSYNLVNAGGVYLRESYRNIGTEQKAEIKTMPFYNSKVDGAEYHSSGLLDFRPTIGANGLVNNTKCVVLPNSSTVNTTLGVYLPRKDLLYISKEGKFKLIYGKPDYEPSYPSLPEDGMILYKISKPEYIFSSKDLTLIYTDNKRYTMRDIGKIEQRVEQLETYSTLSLLEKSADSFLVEDENGNNRFKNGIIVDPFKDHKIGQVSHPDYKISVDSTIQCIRPEFTTTNLHLLPTNSTSLASLPKFVEIQNKNIGVTIETPAGTGGVLPPPGSSLPYIGNGQLSTGLFMLPYTEVPFIVQPQATRAITATPFDFVKKEGVLRLVPREDDWVDTTTLPELNVNLAGENDIWDQILDELNSSPTGPFSKTYGNWSEFSRQSESKTTRSGNRFTRTTNTSIQEGRRITGQELTTSTENISLGERVVNVNIIPYMRGKRLVIVATGMKGNSRIYPFFDGVDVSQHCYSYNSVAEINSVINSASLSESNKFTNGIKKTNGEGSAFIVFDMPTGTFRTGDRKFSLSDNPNNDFTKASTFGSGTYSAYGLSQVRQATSAAIRTFDTRTIDEVEERVRNEVRVQTWSDDPLAQTFLINKELYPDGVFLSSIDLFFARKPDNSTNIPVKVELRPTVNAFPDANKVYPGAKCILHPSQVNLSDFPAANNQQSATRFTFEHPVYLEPGEHSLVVQSTSQDYEVYIAEVGENLLNSTQKVLQQPYVGVFFMSSNASTWQPQPAMDLMMVINKCEFPVNVSHTFTVKTEDFDSNINYQLMNLSASYQEFSNATLSWSYGSSSNLIVNDVNPNENFAFTTSQVLTSGQNLYFQAVGITTNKDISPVINKERLSAFFVNNLIENNTNLQTNGELLPYASGSSQTDLTRARYISKIVTLEEGFESNGFKLVLSVNKPTGTKIQAFLKYQTVEQTQEFHENPYVQLIPKMGEIKFDNFFTQREEQFVDVEFDLPQNTPIEFNKFAIKLCLYSNNPAYVPKIKDLRGIAVL
jgi:hypothetical protein